jgi:hypothetical protein
VFDNRSAHASDNAARPDEPSADLSNVIVNAVFGGIGLRYGSTGIVGEELVELGEVVYARQFSYNGEDEIGWDFALIRIPEEFHDLVVPEMPQYGGPTGPAEQPPEIDGLAQSYLLGDEAHSFGHGIGNGDVYPTKGRTLRVARPGFDPKSFSGTGRFSPGDSGSPVVMSTIDSDDTPPATSDDINSPGARPAGIATHGLGVVVPVVSPAGTTATQAKRMVKNDIGVPIEVVHTPDQLPN